MKKRRGLANRVSSRRVRNQSVPVVERVEDRILLATYFVSSTFDSVTATPNDGTLRGAILESDAQTTPSIIDFMLAGGVQTISLKSPLPAITEPVTIDGTTATGFNGTPLIQVSGLTPNGETSGPAFTVNAGASVIKDLIINNFDGNGIDLNGGADTVTGCWIGLDSTGTKNSMNQDDGILVASSANTIGGVGAGNPNVIAGNGVNQIEVSGVNSRNNVIADNYIGTNAMGTAAVPTTPTSDGILVESSTNFIGTGNNGSGGIGGGNLISGNQEGLILDTGANSNIVEGNYIGTDITGEKTIGNVEFGVYVTGGTKNIIGGLASNDANVISGNGSDGVRISGAGSTLNQVEGNYIGVGANSTTAVGNGGWGVDIFGASQNYVGGATVNLMSDTSAYGNIIQNNDTVGGAGGVTVVNGTNDGILSNSIYQNGSGPGISLNGGNNGVAAPVLTSVQSGAGETEISGTYSGAPGVTYRIQFFSSISPNQSGVGDGQNYLASSDISVIGNSQGQATFNTTISPQVPVGYYVTATATQGVLVTNNTSDFSTAVQTVLALVSDLAVTTTVSTTGPELDQDYTYGLTISNNGPNISASTTLTDTLPANATVVSLPAGATIVKGVVTDNIGQLTSGQSVKLAITVKPTKIGAFNNVAFVIGPNIDSDETNNTSDSNATVVPDADLSLSLTPSTTTAPVGSPITYTLSVNNNGPSVATGTVVTVQFPADFSNILVQSNQGSYTIGTNNLVTLNLGIVPASSSTSVTFTVTPNMVESAFTSAGVASPVADPDSTNNTTSATVTISNAADLGLTMVASPNPVLAGQLLLYTIVVSNNGPSPATAATVVDTLPAGLVFDQAGSSAANGTISDTNGTVTATLDMLAPGDTDTIIIAVTPTVTGLVSNTAAVGDPGLTNGNEIDPDLTNNIVTVAVPISPADIGVDVVNPTDPLFIGSGALFQIQVQNSGPSAATNVTLTDQFVGGGTIIAASLGQFSGGNYSFDLGTLASGQIATIDILFDPSTAGSLTNNASVTSDQYDPDPSNNTSSSSNLVSPVDVGVSVAGPTGPLLYGSPLLYYVTVTNYGPSPATNVLVGDTLPAGSFFGAAVASQGTVAPNPFYTSVSGDLGTLAAGASATIAIYVIPQSTGTETTSAAVSSDDFDTNKSNNLASYSVSVNNLPGQIKFDSSIESVSDTAGSITLLLDRVNGTQGAVSATYFTENYTAIAGANYTATSGTVTFAAGQTSAAITIPILNDGVINPTLGFFVGLGSPTGGATLTAPASTGVLVLNTNRDTTPPVVTGLLAIPNGNQIDGFAISYDKAMNPATAGLASNYYVFLSSGGSLNTGTLISLAAADYNASNDTVILVPTAPLPSNSFYEILINGTVGNAVSDASGNILSGSNGPNSNYVAYYGQGTSLTYIDGQDNKVTLSLTGGGIMGVYRASNGDASIINLYGIVPHSTKLSGKVTKLSKSSSGHTYIGSINGLGSFGQVNSRLTTPGFYVGSALVSAASVSASTVPLTVSAESVTTETATHKKTTSVVTKTVTHKKSTPKGPKHKN